MWRRNRQKKKIKFRKDKQSESKKFYQNVQCAMCDQSRFIKEQEAFGLLSSLGIKTPFSELPFKLPPNQGEEVFVIEKVENTLVSQTNVIEDLNGEETVGTFYENDLQKTNQRRSRFEKVIKRKVH